jgi:mono/diheme cytochrome c family protein
MRLLARHVFAIGVSTGLIAPVLAQDAPGDIASGRHIADALCAACHQIDLGQPEKSTAAPGFAQVAKLPSTTALALNVFLQSSHTHMPNYQLTRQETDDIVAFIMSLKEK